MNAPKSLATGWPLLLLLALTAPMAQAQLSYDPTLSTPERLDGLLQQQSAPLSHRWNDSLWYVSAPGQRPTSIFSDGFESGDVSRFDANGDGTDELVLIREDSQGNPARFIVYDMVFNDTLLVIDLTLPDYAPIRNRQVRFQGFYDFIGEGTKAVAFGGNGALIVDPEDTSHPIYGLGASYSYFGISDFSDDGAMDLLVGNTQLRRVEVYAFFED